MSCLFCKITDGSIPSSKVFENEHVLAFRDIAPQAKIHIVLIPKKHIATMNDVTSEDAVAITEIFVAARQIAIDLGIAESGYRLINNTNSDGGQTVFHLHFHLLGGEKLAVQVN